MAGVAPLLAGLDRDDLPGHHIPESACPKGDDPLACQQAAASSALLDRKDDEFDKFAQVEIVVSGLVLTLAACRCLGSWTG